MSEWQIELEYRDSKSSKFWRGRVDGSEFIVNYGRIGTDGQSKTKNLRSADKASAELSKVAEQKRKKGYVDVEGHSTPAAAPPPAIRSASFVAKRAGKTVMVVVATEGGRIQTEIEETLESPEAAAVCFDAILESLVAAGYQKA